MLKINRLWLISFGIIFNLHTQVTSAETVVVVSINNSAATLSKNQIADIFLGKANRFPNGQLATPIDQIDGSNVRNDFYEKFAGKSPTQLKAHWSMMIFTGRGRPPPAVLNSIEIKQQILKNPNGIGYMDDSDLDGSIRVILIQ